MTTTTADVVSAAAAALADATGDDVAALSDDALLSLQAEIGGVRHRLDALAAIAAGVIAQRSRHELGYAGLAQSKGFRTPENLLQTITGTTRAEATKLVRVGAMTATVQPVELEPLTLALTAGSLSVEAADAIRRGLGEPDPAVPADDYRAAVHRLIAAAVTVDPDAVFTHARRERDTLDAAGIASRANQQRDLRYFRTHRKLNGTVTGSFLLDAEDGELVLSAIDTILSPRRGGPRFTDPDEAAAAETLVADTRSNDQIAADTFVAMIRLAIDADPGTLFGSRRPAVRVVVTETSITNHGHGHLQNSGEPVPFPSIEAHLCNTGTLGIRFDHTHQVLNLGRTQRLFTQRQRIGLAARDGGCRFPGCDRPPSWCEAHHINQWERDGGRTDLADGILLCRHHHMLTHNNGWHFTRDEGRYFLIPPPTIDPQQQPIETRSRSPILRELADARR